jgi:hypothetical protein
MIQKEIANNQDSSDSLEAKFGIFINKKYCYV